MCVLIPSWEWSYRGCSTTSLPFLQLLVPPLRSIKKPSVYKMVYPYPIFCGGKDEDVDDYLERFEVAMITNQVFEDELVMRLLKVVLKGDARRWFVRFEMQEEAEGRKVTFESVRRAMSARFQRRENAGEVYDLLKVLKQKRGELVADFVKRFEDMWGRWCEALGAERPPNFLKKTLLIEGLEPLWKLKVELKQPKTYEDAVCGLRSIKNGSCIGSEILVWKWMRLLCLRFKGYKRHLDGKIGAIKSPQILCLREWQVQCALKKCLKSQSKWKQSKK